VHDGHASRHACWSPAAAADRALRAQDGLVQIGAAANPGGRGGMLSEEPRGHLDRAVGQHVSGRGDLRDGVGREPDGRPVARRARSSPPVLSQGRSIRRPLGAPSGACSGPPQQGRWGDRGRVEAPRGCGGTASPLPRPMLGRRPFRSGERSSRERARPDVTRAVTSRWRPGPVWASTRGGTMGS